MHFSACTQNTSLRMFFKFTSSFTYEILRNLPNHIRYYILFFVIRSKWLNDYDICSMDPCLQWPCEIDKRTNIQWIIQWITEHLFIDVYMWQYSLPFMIKIRIHSNWQYTSKLMHYTIVNTDMHTTEHIRATNMKSGDKPVWLRHSQRCISSSLKWQASRIHSHTHTQTSHRFWGHSTLHSYICPNKSIICLALLLSYRLFPPHTRRNGNFFNGLHRICCIHDSLI